MIDHFAYDKTTGSQDHASVLSSGFVAAPAVLPPGLKTPVLFRGVGLSVPDSSETVRGRQAGCCCCMLHERTARGRLPALAHSMLTCPPHHHTHTCAQAFIALRGSPTAYSGKPGEAALDAKLAGPSMALVALVQARNNARVAVAGSLHMFSDAAYDAQATDRTGSRCVLASVVLVMGGVAWCCSQPGVRAGLGGADHAAVCSC